MTELNNRGVGDILIAVVDGLKGIPEAISAAFPQTQIQTSIVHMILNSLDYVGWKDRKAVVAELKTIYTVPRSKPSSGCAGSLFRQPVGPEISAHCANLAATLAGSHSLLCLPAGGTQNHLYHQRHRELEYAGTQSNQEPWPLP